MYFYEIERFVLFFRNASFCGLYFFKNNNEANVEKNVRTKKYFGCKISKPAAKHIFRVGTTLQTNEKFHFRVGTTLQTNEKFHFCVGTTLQANEKFHFCVGTTLRPTKNSIFALERPSGQRKILFSRWNDPQNLREIFFLVGTTPVITGNFIFLAPQLHLI